MVPSSPELRVSRASPPSGVLRVPGDKSISHRAAILGALAEGVTRISGFLAGEDCLATLTALRRMSVKIEGPQEGEVVVHGVGLHGLSPPDGPLDLGNSGTSMRLLAGLLAGQRFTTELTGDESLRRRPMGRVAEPLSLMGAHVEIREERERRPPFALLPVSQLRAIYYRLPVPSAQVKSALLLAGLYAEGETCITEAVPTRDHTERMLEAFAYPVRRLDSAICVPGGRRLIGTRLRIPGDLSSAVFFMVGACIVEGAELTIKDVGINPTRSGCIEILRRMGAEIRVTNERMWGGEPVADLWVVSRPLIGIEIPQELVPLAIDEFPVLFVAAAVAEGRTVLRGAAELRVKESDRIQAMAEGLARLGIRIEPREDGLDIEGGYLQGGRVQAYGDHRVAMAFAIAALAAEAPIWIEGATGISTSFPGFFEVASQAGVAVKGVGERGDVE